MSLLSSFLIPRLPKLPSGVLDQKWLDNRSLRDPTLATEAKPVQIAQRDRALRCRQGRPGVIMISKTTDRSDKRTVSGCWVLLMIQPNRFWWLDSLRVELSRKSKTDTSSNGDGSRGAPGCRRKPCGTSSVECFALIYRWPNLLERRSKKIEKLRYVVLDFSIPLSLDYLTENVLSKYFHIWSDGILYSVIQSPRLHGLHPVWSEVQMDNQ